MNLVAKYLCVYLISCVNENSQSQLEKCPDHCTCYNAPSPISFNDDDEFDDKKSKLNFLKFIV